MDGATSNNSSAEKNGVKPIPVVPLQQPINPMLNTPGLLLPNGATADAATQHLWQTAWLNVVNQQQQQQQQFNQQQPYVATATTTPNPLAAKRKSEEMVDITANGTKKAKSGPSVVSNTSKGDAPPVPKSESDLAKLSATERRRYERNLREQQRSYKISQQIKQLREVLQESNIPFRPNKYSILVSVAEYIQQLQSRAIMLDSEHQRLIDTIRETTERASSANNNSNEPLSSTEALENDALLVQGIDYKSVFTHCPYPLGVATLDGRVLACNRPFETLLNVAPNSMNDQSFFVFIRNHQEIFEAMAALLKRSTQTIETGEGTVTSSKQLLFWCGHILSSGNERVRCC